MRVFNSLCIFAAFYGLLYIWRKVAISSDLFLEIQAVPRRVLSGFSPYLSPDIGPTARPYGPIWDRRDGRKQVSTSNLAFYCGTPERDNFDIIQHKKSTRIELFHRYRPLAVSASFLLPYCLRTRAATVKRQPPPPPSIPTWLSRCLARPFTWNQHSPPYSL
jgi:hypothetical protein